MRTTKDDTIDLREIAGTIRREKRWVAVGLLCGLLAAIGVLLLVRPSYRASATALLQADAERTPSALALLGGLADALPTDGLGGAIETEIQLLTSRAVYGTVVDSLFLQARVRAPRSTSARDVFVSATFDRVPPEGSYTFRKTGETYRVEGGGQAGDAVAGQPYGLPGAVVRVSPGAPEEFRIQVLTREEAIDRLEEAMVADQAGGDVAQLVYDGEDPETAAAVPNAVIAEYLHRKTTTDRGINQHRYEFLRARADSVATELAQAAEALRMAQERTGVIDPMLNGEYQLEAAMQVRQALTEVQVELASLGRIMSEGDLSGSALAAFPTLLQSPAMNELVALLGEVTAEREGLLERRTPEDPEVVALTNTADLLERQMAELAGGYLAGLREQEVELLSEYATHQEALAALPARAEENLQLQREVERLAQTELVLQTQLIDARLAAIGEGGNVRQIDVAVPPEEQNFPQPLPTLLIGLFGGMVLGVVGALGVGFLSQRVRDPYDAELAAGVPAVAFQPGAPLLLGGLEGRGTVLVVPIGMDGRAPEVARQLAITAQLQGKRAAVVDLHAGTRLVALPAATSVAPVAAGTHAGGAAGALVPYGAEQGEGDGVRVYRIVGDEATAERVRVGLDKLEEEHDLVIAVTPHLEDAATAALLSPRRFVILVGRSGHVTRPEIQSAVISLGRLGVTIPGLVITNGA